MAKITSTKIIASSDTASVQDWIQDVHDLLVGSGLTQTADTGQIVIASVTYALNANYGYEIYRFNDALQATAPVFLKFVYRQGATNLRPGVDLFIGSGTDGAGNLTNSVTVLSQVPSLNVNTTAYPSYACYTGAFFGFSWQTNVASHPSTFFAIERAHDTNGAPTAGGLLYLCAQGGAAPKSYGAVALPSWTAVGTIGTSAGVFSANAIATAANQPDDEVLLFFSRLPGKNPAIPWYRIAYAAANKLQTGETAEFTPFGATARTYISTQRGDQFANVTDSLARIMMGWED